MRSEKDLRKIHAIVWARFMSHANNAIIAALEGFKWLEENEDSVFTEELIEEELSFYLSKEFIYHEEIERMINGIPNT